MENGQKKYSWNCYGGKFSAQMVGEQFEAIEKRDGKLTKAAVVDAARAEDSPMHGMFEWDDAVAGELYRQDQAHFYIRHLEVEIVKVGSGNGKTVTTRGFMNVTPVNAGNREKAGAYVNTLSATQNPETYRIVLERAKNELRMFREKYRDIKELEPVFAVINQVAMDLEGA